MTVRGLRTRLPLMILISITTLPHSAAGLSSTVPCRKSQAEKLIDFVKSVKSSDRKTFDEYAAQRGLPVSTIQKKFAATGLLECGKAQTTAQITESSSVITTSRHFFVANREGKCEERAALKVKECYFYTHDGTGWNVQHTVKTDSLKMGACNSQNTEGDWAVLKLDKPAQGIKPYQVTQVPKGYRESPKVINPAAYSLDFKVGNDYPRVISDCDLIRVGSVAETSCTAGQGASGSANLVEDGDKLKIMAIAIGTEQYPNGRTINISTPMNGEFYEAVMAAAGK